jgi:hypothetical protein
MLEIKEREIIYQERKLVRAEDLVWRRPRDSPNTRITELLQAPVLRPDGEELLLRGWHRTRFGFSLMRHRTVPIRLWNFHNHRNPDGALVRGPHKQPCHDRQYEKWAYPVSDIPVHNRDVALQAFLKECNIHMIGQQSFLGLVEAG